MEAFSLPIELAYEYLPASSDFNEIDAVLGEL